MSLHMVFQIVALVWPNITIDIVRYEVSASDEHYKEYIDVEHDTESSDEDPSIAYSYYEERVKQDGYSVEGIATSTDEEHDNSINTDSFSVTDEYSS